MKYSVLMSVYKNDSPEFLKLALESIYDNQTRKPDEIVVVFDGPLTDELHKILDAFYKGKENVVFYYPQEVNRGLGEALRIGSEKCTGDYIFRMDSDDISHSERFEKQIAYIESHPEIDVLGTDIAEFQQTETETNKRVRTCPEKHEEILKMIKKRNPINHVTACIKKSSLEKSGGYKALTFVEDYYLWLNMIVSGCKFANIKESLVYVRVGNGFEARRASKEIIKGRKELIDFMLAHKMITLYEAKINMVCVWCLVNSPVKIKKFIYDKFLRK